MKKTILQKVLCLLTAVLLAVCCALPACADDFDEYTVEINIKNAPKGTCYADILVPKDKNPAEIRRYAETPVSDSENHIITIGKDSGITLYDNGGYVSLSSRTSYVERIKVSDDRTRFELVKGEKNNQLGKPIAKIFSCFGSFRVAYVDKSGKVLNVTDICDKAEITTDGQNRLDTDGSSLTITLYKQDKVTRAKAWGIVYYIGLALVVILLVIDIILKHILTKHKKRQKNS